jgi:hypothetical protein
MSPQNCVWAKGESREERWWRLLTQYNAGPRANRQLFNLNGNPPSAPRLMDVRLLLPARYRVWGPPTHGSGGWCWCWRAAMERINVHIVIDGWGGYPSRAIVSSHQTVKGGDLVLILFYLFLFLLPLHSLASPLFFVLFVSSLTVRSTSLAREINDRPSSDVFSLYTHNSAGRATRAAAA